MNYQEFLEFCETTHQQLHGSPRLLLEIAINKKIYHPQAKFISVSVVKNCADCDLFMRFAELPAPLQQIKSPQIGQIWH